MPARVRDPSRAHRCEVVRQYLRGQNRLTAMLMRHGRIWRDGSYWTQAHRAWIAARSIRRAVGFKLRRAEGLLFSFVEFLEAARATRVTTQLALRWATLPAAATPGWQEQPAVCRPRLRPAHERD
jgi:hypothetical protein